MRGCAASCCAAATRSASGGSARVSLSGLPGLASHQTRSRPSRFSAIRLAARWAACGGLNEPPNSPIFMPGACGGRRGGALFDSRFDSRARRFTRFTYPACGGGRRRKATAGGGPLPIPPPPSRADLARTPHAIFEAAELLQSDRPARVQSPGGDADLGPEAELAAVGELGRGVVQHDRGVHLGQEFLCS